MLWSDPPRLVTVQWPTFIGGPLDGKDVPWVTMDQYKWPPGEEGIEAPIFERVNDQMRPGLGAPNDYPNAIRSVTYVLHRPKFAVGTKGVCVETLAHEGLSLEQVAWLLLCAGFNVPSDAI